MSEITRLQKLLLNGFDLLGLKHDSAVLLTTILDTEDKRAEMIYWMTEHMSAKPEDLTKQAIKIAKK